MEDAAPRNPFIRLFTVWMLLLVHTDCKKVALEKNVSSLRTKSVQEHWIGIVWKLEYS